MEKEKKMEKITKYIFEAFGDKIKNELGTSDDESEYDLHIQICHDGYKFIELQNKDKFRNDDTIDINLGRIYIYDNYDMNEAKKRLSDDEIESDAFDSFEENFNFEKYVREKIEEQLTKKEINKLYYIFFSE